MLHVNFGDASRWDGLLVLDRLETADIEMEDVTFRMGGLAQNLEDPATRKVTVNLEGLATGLWSPKPEIARALGTRVDLFADATLEPRRADRPQPAAGQRQRPLDLQRRVRSRT